MSTPTPIPNITLLPVSPTTDYLSIAQLEALAFAHDEWALVTFGPDNVASNLPLMTQRASTLALPPPAGEEVRNMKAVLSGPGGEEQIVGFASWVFVQGREEGKKDEEEKKEEEEEVNRLGSRANMKLFEDSIIRADEHMERSTGGRDYASESSISLLLETRKRFFDIGDITNESQSINQAVK